MKRFSSSFKSLLVVMLIFEIIPLVALADTKLYIIANEFAYEYTVYQFYALYIAISLYLLVSPFIYYSDYKDLVKYELTIPKPWKKVFVLTVSIGALLISILITLYLK